MLRLLRALQPRPRAVPAPIRLVIGLALLVLLGTVLLMLPISSTGRALTWNEAMFTTVSALTVTGLSVIAPGRDLSVFGEAVLLALIQLGGLGAMVAAVALLRVLGWQIDLHNRMALRDALGLNSLGDLLKIVRRAIYFIGLVEVAGAVTLFLHWRTRLPLPPAQIAWYALFHAISAMCNAGFDLFGGLAEFPAGLPNDDVTMLVLCVLIVIGGIGIPVITDLARYRSERVLRLHTKIALATSLVLTLGGGLMLFLAEGGEGGVLAGEPGMGRRLTLSLAQSVSARTAGFAFLPQFERITHASQFLLNTLMFIGASPASMGGGIKTVTFAVLLMSLFSYIRNLPEITLDSRTVGKSVLQKASAILVAGLFVVVTSTWLILMLMPRAPMEHVLFEVVSAFATCGLSLAFTGQLSLPAQFIIMLAMFWGRLGALTIINAIALPRKRTLVRYADAEVFVG
jgi:trk system potassium uptake protein TrkH